MRVIPVVLGIALVVLGRTWAFAQTAGPDWAGTWKGVLTNAPARPGAKPVDITIELGPFPATDGACARWKTTYSEDGAVRGVKDYRLCRGAGPDDLYIDEGDGVKLTARWIDGVLVAPFKYGAALLVSSLRVRGDVLEEEILTVDDKPATTGVVPLTPRTIQRLTATRVR